MSNSFDLAIVGAGVVGLGHALAAMRRGLKVCVIDRDARANGASVRNFGFVTVTGQQRGECWNRAVRSRDIWAEVAPQAGIDVIHRGLMVAVRRDEALPVLEAFMATEMGEGCSLLTPDEAGDVNQLNMSLSVNGEQMQSGNTRNMIFNCEFLVHYLSQFMTLEPGDLISSGTPPGVGLGMKPPRYLKAGDVVNLAIEGLGAQQQLCVQA